MKNLTLKNLALICALGFIVSACGGEEDTPRACSTTEAASVGVTDTDTCVDNSNEDAVDTLEESLGDDDQVCTIDDADHDNDSTTDAVTVLCKV